MVINQIIKFNLLLILSVFLISCGSNETKKNATHEAMHKTAVKPTSSTGTFGEAITADNALPASELPKMLANKKEIETKLYGKIDTVCQTTGSWMDVALDNGETIHITMKDDAFLLPMDATGKNTVFEGIGTYEEIPVNLLRLMAEDEGKSKEEIDAITSPKREYSFVANGVIIKN